MAAEFIVEGYSSSPLSVGLFPLTCRGPNCINTNCALGRLTCVTLTTLAPITEQA
jgi:hypothetical protein